MDFRTFLQQMLDQRRARNPRYSARAFAKQLRISPATLSEILNGRRIPSLAMARKIADAASIAPSVRSTFLGSVTKENLDRDLARVGASWTGGELFEPPTTQGEVDEANFKSISDWYHYAILELTEVEGFRPDPLWIARELGISRAQAVKAVNRLRLLGLLTQSEHGQWTKAKEFFTTQSSHQQAKTSTAHRRHQKQVFSRAILALESRPLSERSMTSLTMAIDPHKLPEARKMIQTFQRRLMGLLTSGRRKSVYELGVCLYPVQRREKAASMRIK